MIRRSRSVWALILTAGAIGWGAGTAPAAGRWVRAGLTTNSPVWGVRGGLQFALHPGGFTHGPHPKALSRMLVQPKPATDEYAVMVDTRDALEIGEAAKRVEWAGYVDSWKGTGTGTSV